MNSVSLTVNCRSDVLWWCLYGSRVVLLSLLPSDSPLHVWWYHLVWTAGCLAAPFLPLRFNESYFFTFWSPEPSLTVAAHSHKTHICYCPYIWGSLWTLYSERSLWKYRSVCLGLYLQSPRMICSHDFLRGRVFLRDSQSGKGAPTTAHPHGALGYNFAKFSLKDTRNRDHFIPQC